MHTDFVETEGLRLLAEANLHLDYIYLTVGKSSNIGALADDHVLEDPFGQAENAFSLFTRALLEDSGQPQEERRQVVQDLDALVSTLRVLQQSVERASRCAEVSVVPKRSVDSSNEVGTGGRCRMI